MLIDLAENERQTLVVALAELAAARPGWEDLAAALAAKLGGPTGPAWSRHRDSAAEARAEGLAARGEGRGEGVARA